MVLVVCNLCKMKLKFLPAIAIFITGIGVWRARPISESVPWSVSATGRVLRKLDFCSRRCWAHPRWTDGGTCAARRSPTANWVILVGLISLGDLLVVGCCCRWIRALIAWVIRHRADARARHLEAGYQDAAWWRPCGYWQPTAGRRRG